MSLEVSCGPTVSGITISSLRWLGLDASSQPCQLEVLFCQEDTYDLGLHLRALAEAILAEATKENQQNRMEYPGGVRVTRYPPKPLS